MSEGKSGLKFFSFKSFVDTLLHEESVPEGIGRVGEEKFKLFKCSSFT